MGALPLPCWPETVHRNADAQKAFDRRGFRRPVTGGANPTAAGDGPVAPGIKMINDKGKALPVGPERFSYSDGEPGRDE